MGITRIHLKNFTAFDDLDMQVSPGLNVLIGENGTGKTHLMKVAYAACAFIPTGVPLFSSKLHGVFQSEETIKRNLISYPSLIRKKGKEKYAVVEVWRGEELHYSDSIWPDIMKSPPYYGKNFGQGDWINHPVEVTFIPPKEILSMGPGLLSQYVRREMVIEETYIDLLHQAYLYPLREGVLDSTSKRLMKQLQDRMGGKVTLKGETFYLSNSRGDLEFMLVAEGIRKLGLLWVLIRNGLLLRDSILFWDEPEANLNPKLYGVVIDVLLELQRMGVQIFIATHDYVILKEIDLRMKPDDKVLFHSLYKDPESKEVKCSSTADYLQIEPNAIAATFDDLYSREIKRGLEGDTNG